MSFLPRLRGKRRIGFTGTEDGMTDPQWEMVKRAVIGLAPLEAHHGDCVGADREFHDIVLENTDCPVVVHPPIKPDKRAFVPAGERVQVLHQYDYMVRNGHIVDESDMLIAAPKEMEEIVRSGVWATVRRARSAKVPILMVYPDGSSLMNLPIRKGVI